MQSDGGNQGNAHGGSRPVTSPGERKNIMTKTYTITDEFNDIEKTTTYTVRTCTAIPASIGETRRVNALYVDYYEYSGEHFESVVFNEPMPEDEEEFVQLFDYPEEWDSYSDTLETVQFTDDEE